MWKFTAYLDESHDDVPRQRPRKSAPGVFAIAGFIAPANDWSRFDSQWRRVLAEYEIDPDEDEFHASDCESGTGLFSRDNLKNRRNDLRADLVDTIGGIRCPRSLGYR